MNALDSFLWRLNIEHDDKDKPALAQQYEKLASKFNELYLAGKERSREAMALALEKANEKMTAMGAFSVERGEKLKHYLTRDLDQTLADARHRGEGAKERLNPGRLGVGALSSRVAALDATGNALHSRLVLSAPARCSIKAIDFLAWSCHRAVSRSLQNRNHRMHRRTRMTGS